MDAERAERQAKFVATAAAHAEDFKTRVAQHDRDNSFPHENVAAMKASGYTNMTAPAELGGGGADILDEVLAQERLARGDLPTAISINMHLFAVGWLGDLWRAGGSRDGNLRTFLESIVQGRLILGGGVSDPKINSMLGFGGVINTSRRAEKVAGGYIVNGAGKFSTMSAAADFLFETARFDDPKNGPTLLSFYIPAKTPGIKIQGNWDTMSIRASSSQDIIWENVFVPEEGTNHKPVGTWDESLKIFCRWNPSIEACYLGLAQAARDWALKWTGDRRQEPFDRPMSHYPQNQFLAAEMEVAIRAARAMLLHTATAIAETPVGSEQPMMDIIACHHFVCESAVSIVDKAMRMVGGVGLFKSGPLEQMYRDVRAAIIHQPFQGYDALAWLGKLAFGIRHDSLPRWV
ncbi:MAG: acyl-CoA dehydrogenase family protein [Candidatus Binataceae bacterium]